ncbi:hypothetical protein BOH66_16340 [Microbacterium aurum]|uniref:Uncharacterized protein n=1 Tax=Microbacterium aurum TaxID=36805 RepID=A0A1P8UC49_9MICO|nr:hypothetical protein [Microbacterium aurum]APZ35625.1 hypothetical protein BOH66_16340 [Microbacterium aurum]MBM7826355.1 hypothetical protein [Microbacterium aurum]
MAALALLSLPILLVGWIIKGVTYAAGWLMNLYERYRARKRAAIEAELDRTQAELRGTILGLADALGMEAHEARKALIRESYRASGQLPDA